MDTRDAMFAVAALTFVVACAESPDPSVTQSGNASDRSAIDANHERFLAAMRANNTDSLVALLTDDVTFDPPNEPSVRGREATRAWNERLLSQVRTSAVSVTDREVLVDGNLAVERGSFTWTVTPVGGGSPMVDEGKFVAIYRKQADGSWKVSHDIWNSSRPAAGTTGAKRK